MKRILTLLFCGMLLAGVSMAQYAGSASGSSTAAAEINGKINHQEGSGPPTSVNGTLGKDTYTDTATGDVYGVITTGTPATWRRISSGGYVTYTGNQTGLAADDKKIVKMNGSSITYTLPSPPPHANWSVAVQNIASSDLTIARNSLTINGGTSNITLKQYSVVFIWTDGTNYLSTVPLVAGANITLTPAVNGITIASTGGSSSGCVPSGSAGQLLSDSGTGTCNSIAAFSFATNTLTASSSAILDLSAAATSGIKLPGAFSTGILHITTTTGAITSSTIGTSDIAANAVTSAKHSVETTRRTVCLPIGANNGSALADADLGPQSRQFFLPYAGTLVEMEVAADAGTPNIILGRSRAGTVVNVVSAALATAASGGIACSSAAGGPGLDGATTCASTLQNTSWNVGDWVTLVSGTAGGTAKEMTACLTFVTVN